MLLLSFEPSLSGGFRYQQDVLKILSRFNSFMGRAVSKGTIPTLVDYAGLRLNMRQFHRALVTGTGQTKRSKHAKTQANLHPYRSSQTAPKMADKCVQTDEQEFIETPDLSFSDDTPPTTTKDQVTQFMQSQDNELINFIQSSNMPNDIWLHNINFLQISFHF